MAKSKSRQDTVVSAADIAKAVQKTSLKSSFPSSRKVSSTSPGTRATAITKRDFEKTLENMRNRIRQMKSPIDMEKLAEQTAQQALNDFPIFVDGSSTGTPTGTFVNAVGQVQDDPVQSILDDVANTASGSLGGVGDLVSGNTMELARQMASGVVDTTGELAEGILGDTSEVLARKVMDEYPQYQDQTPFEATPSKRVSVSASVSISVTVPAPEVCTAVTSQVAGAMEQCTSAMACGVAKLQALNSAVGGLNGAVKLLTASIQKALDMKIAQMMSKIVSAIKTAHGITHPLFEAIFQMTWDQNLQWKPNFGGVCADWMKCVKEIPEYFDFIQKVMGGAIAEIMKGCDKLFTQVVQACGGLSNMSISASIGISVPVPPLSVPLMSISKQIEDVMNKIMVIKEIIRQKAKQVLQKLKSLQAPELFINVPKDFFLILEVLVEAEFIYANLHIVMDKLLEFFMNLLVKKFTECASKIIDQLFSIWSKVIEIVPPLDDLLKLAWAIPNKADFCCNIALNIALPNMWSIIQPYINMPFECINMISSACDAATELAYAIPPP